MRAHNMILSPGGFAWLDYGPRIDPSDSLSNHECCRRPDRPSISNATAASSLAKAAASRMEVVGEPGRGNATEPSGVGASSYESRFYRRGRFSWLQVPLRVRMPDSAGRELPRILVVEDSAILRCIETLVERDCLRDMGCDLLLDSRGLGRGVRSRRAAGRRSCHIAR